MELYFLGFLLIIIFFITIYEFSKIEKINRVITSRDEYNIDIYDFAFSQPYVRITRGDYVTWKNFDQPRHQIITDNKFLPNSPLMLQFDTYRQVFYEPGEYIYYSPLYKKMKSMIVIVE